MSTDPKKQVRQLCAFLDEDADIIRDIVAEPLDDVHSFLYENGVDPRETVADFRHAVRTGRDPGQSTLWDQLRFLLSQFASRPALSFSLTIVVAIIGLQLLYPEAPPPERERGVTPVIVDPSVDAAAEALEDLYAQIMMMYADGRFTEAEPLTQEVLRTVEDIRGSDHPDTANALNNLAVVEKKLGKYREAGDHYERALRIQEEQLGPTHPGTMTTRRNLGLLYEETGRYERAEKIYKGIFETQKDEFGINDTRTIESRNNLIEFYRKFGNSF
ncbi:MAG: tetratricopeptide repeat protein [Candidatus Omnitrophica bacterium]|nr:tetratricopeptide repeat protein [Candidatus Omnitrophota bacterium]